MTSWVLMALDRLLALRVSEALQPRSLASQAAPPQTYITAQHYNKTSTKHTDIQPADTHQAPPPAHRTSNPTTQRTFKHRARINTTPGHGSRARRHLAAGSLSSYSCFQRAPALHAPTHNTIHTVKVVGYCQKPGDGTDGRNHIINYSIIP